MRARAVRLVFENEADYRTRSECFRSISQKIGRSPETLRDWVNKQGVETGDREGLTLSERAQMKDLQRENRELKQANDILRKAPAFFAAADLDRLLKFCCCASATTVSILVSRRFAKFCQSRHLLPGRRRGAALLPRGHLFPS